MKKSIFLVLLLVLSLLVISCSKKKEESAGHKTDEKSDPTRSELYVTINGEKITKGDFMDFISYSHAMMDPENQDNKAVLTALRDDFIRHRVLLQEAKKHKVQIDEKKFSEMLAAFKTDKGEKVVNEFEEELDIDFESVKKLLRERALVNEFLGGVSEEITVSDRELKDYFNKRKSELTGIKKAHIFHIVTSDEAKAAEAMRMLQKGISFAEVAEKYSVAPEAANGGDLGYVDVTEFPDIFQEALKLKIGETSQIMKSEYGWHIFKLADIQQNDKINFDDVKDELHDELYGIKQEKILKDYIDELYSKTEIVFASNSSDPAAPAKPQSGDNK